MIKILNFFIKNLLFPKFCFGCGTYNTYLCEKCATHLFSQKINICPYCYKQNPFGFTCQRCKEGKKIEGIFSVFLYNGLGKVLIKKIKYKLVKEALSDLFKYLPKYLGEDLRYIRCFFPKAIILSVPLHNNREKKRGFNQSDIIAQKFSKLLMLEYQKDYLLKIKNTSPQAQLIHKLERTKNIKDAFIINHKHIGSISNKDFIIVDDVWSSGATIKEIGKLLKRGGAGKIYGLTLAR